MKRERAGQSQLEAGTAAVERRHDLNYYRVIVSVGEAFKIMRRRLKRRPDAFPVSRQTVNKWEAGRSWSPRARELLMEMIDAEASR